MHTDAQTLENGTVLEGDLCIVGAGAAGISLALEWIGTPYRVLLLEGGGFDYDVQVQDLYRGEIVGQPYLPIEAIRLHYFGGTTGHWAGFCAPYDPIDFEKRDWVPYSGWPITRADLDPYYARAHPVLELGPYEYDAAYWEQQDPDLVRLPLDASRIYPKMWQFSPPTRFGQRYRDPIVNAPNVHLYTHANVTEIEANEAVTAVEGLRVRTLDGKEHRVRARHYVLACCSIQNARLLLASNRQAPRGLGNDHDLVGRFFMEHFEMPSAQLVLAQPEAMKLYLWTWGATKARAEVGLTADMQRALRVLNGTSSLRPGVIDENTRSIFQNFDTDPEALRRRRERQAAGGPASDNRPPPTPTEAVNFMLHVRQEQAPNPASRVTLGEETDALGVPRTKLSWQLTELDKRSIRVLYETIGQEVGRAGLGRVQLMDWLLGPDDRTWPASLSGGWHHMGTTRMHADPKQGVVDPNGKVHGLANLYTAGASNFPTAGAANPTLTLVALTLRLSDHLKARVAQG